ncbi:hypothetical protein GCK72_007519 [Caenorhabditis remanei]|uniref:Uncharacterized protein n=1 Tax=Caenorhabditis remanei TaxID=31234 RepID=A0A6A5HHI5_CAERE|nr:hypothetical protein GCK72_007519 [Caenorhabditis remanei]KAF1767560.1 hypothetical protein GCK72_007519 [Caenorhabditis remanei]
MSYDKSKILSMNITELIQILAAMDFLDLDRACSNSDRRALKYKYVNNEEKVVLEEFYNKSMLIAQRLNSLSEDLRTVEGNLRSALRCLQEILLGTNINLPDPEEHFIKYRNKVDQIMKFEFHPQTANKYEELLGKVRMDHDALLSRKREIIAYSNRGTYYSRQHRSIQTLKTIELKSICWNLLRSNITVGVRVGKILGCCNELKWKIYCTGWTDFFNNLTVSNYPITTADFHRILKIHGYLVNFSHESNTGPMKWTLVRDDSQSPRSMIAHLNAMVNNATLSNSILTTTNSSNSTDVQDPVIGYSHQQFFWSGGFLGN